MKGHQVLRLFDFLAIFPAGAGAFPQVSEGVCFTINSSARKSEGVTINGRPIDPEKTYAIATNSYLAGGGDGYKILLEALDRYDTSTFQRDVLVEYIASVRKKLKPELEGRIQITKTWNRDELVNPHDIGMVAPANENVGSATVPTWQAGSPALPAIGQGAFSVLYFSDSLPQILVSSHLCCPIREIPAH
jgi:hypothetical protein